MCIRDRLYSNKGVNLPNTKISLPCLTKKDKEDLKFILNEQIEWVALSFIRSNLDIKALRRIIKNKRTHHKIIAKIEKPELQERKISNIKVEDTIKETREVDFDEMGVHKSNIYNFDLLEPGMEFTGPAIVEDPSTTVVIFPKQKCKVDKFANLHISIGGENSE